MNAPEELDVAKFEAGHIADVAMALAEEFLERGSRELATLASGHREVFYRAAQLVRARVAVRDRRPAASPEHLAFSLIIAAHELSRPGAGAAPAARKAPRRAPASPRTR